MEEVWNMSQKEIDRYNILTKVLSKELKQRQAATFLNISDRQIRNLLKAVKNQGVKGIISKKRGRISNHHKPCEFKKMILRLVNDKYHDFGPTLAQEKLEELHGCKISVETLRNWMITESLWIPRKKKTRKHITRQRRECFGELIQADGSHHHWFGEDQPKANLTVLVDDATGMLTSLLFSEGETLDAYFEAFEKHLKLYGRPRAFYTDRYAVFQSRKKIAKTQMQRALEDLDIQLILANSPQAKGRVERANRTLQDRLIKELKMRGIKNIEEANAFLPIFIKIYNNNFSKKPMSNVDAHRPLEGYEITQILCRRETRTLLSDCVFQFNNTLYKVQDIPNLRRKTKRKVTIYLTRDGELRVFHGVKELKFAVLGEIEAPPVLDRKEVQTWNPRKTRPQPSSHPWKRKSYEEDIKRSRLKGKVERVL
jgi:hypothetical protein